MEGMRCSGLGETIDCLGLASDPQHPREFLRSISREWIT